MPLEFEVRNGLATLQVRLWTLYSFTTNQAAIIARAADDGA